MSKAKFLNPEQVSRRAQHPCLSLQKQQMLQILLKSESNLTFFGFKKPKDLTQKEYEDSA